jgi:hypothetical protein
MTPGLWALITILAVAIPVAVWLIWRADRRHGGDDLASASMEALQALQVLRDEERAET